MAQKLNILKFIAPELEEGIGIEQNQAHRFDVFEHNLRTAQHAADKRWGLATRLAALFHDVGKPATRQWSGEKRDWTFHGHDVVGARMTKKVLDRLKFPKKTTEEVCTLVRWHMFFSDTEKITLSAVRRLVRNVGEPLIWDLMNLRICDRIGTGRPKEQPYRFRKYKAMVEEALRSPVSVQMLAIGGDDIMRSLNIPAGPKIGHILHALLEEVLDDPQKNSAEYLDARTREIAGLPEAEIELLGKQGRGKRGEIEARAVGEIRKRYWVE
jgi:poly(A) polymerase/tRNA nucleotidyltransferase (CCA-adding enzyme)